MPGELSVHLNRSAPHEIEAEGATVGGAFTVLLENHGRGLHVHLRLDTDLARVAEIGAPNHFVEEDSIRRVPVEVDVDALPVEGRLEVVTGYGAEKAFIPVRIEEPGSARRTVQVDEGLATPATRRSSPRIDPDILPLIGLGSVATVIAIVAILIVRDPAVLVGVLAVLLSLAVAAALLLR